MITILESAIIASTAIALEHIIIYFINKSPVYKTWEVGDFVRTKDKEMNDWLASEGVELTKLIAWDKTSFYCKFKEGTKRLKYSMLDYNKSDNWRTNAKNASKVMNKKVEFGEVKQWYIKKSTGSSSIGKPIELLTEIECQVHLKQAIADENYTLAEQIRKQMEKYR